MEDQNGTLGSTIREGDDGYIVLNVIEMANLEHIINTDTAGLMGGLGPAPWLRSNPRGKKPRMKE